MTTASIPITATLLLTLSLLIAAPQPGTSSADAQLAQSIHALAGPDAAAEAAAARKILEFGDAAVPSLATLVGDPKSLAPRLIAVELLGRIGTPGAIDALLQGLPAERNLAVRGQICIQLGYARDQRAVPLIADWLKTINPSALDDVRGPKEAQPSTCYIRHVEALGMIGDERAIPILEDFARKIPQGVGYGGFVSNFVAGAAAEALEDLKDRAAFWNAVRKYPGLEQTIGPLFNHLHRDRLARFRLADDEIFRHTLRGNAILLSLQNHQDPAIAAAARQLLLRWDNLAI
jgi:HEAT repeat protein